MCFMVNKITQVFRFYSLIKYSFLANLGVNRIQSILQIGNNLTMEIME